MRVGILGGGQLGRMLAGAALNLGLTPCLYDPDPGACGFALGQSTVGSFEDEDALKQFAQNLDVCTYEFENVPVAAASLISTLCPLLPGVRALEVGQDRLTEKNYFRSLGLATTDYLGLEPGAPLPSGGILKTRRLGYDGKGQGTSWKELGEVPALWEKRVPFERELAQIGVRSATGELAFYPLVQTIQSGGILREAIAPARELPPEVELQAREAVQKILLDLDYVGVLALEFFLVGDKLLASEFAPRVHNSGHWSDRGCKTSQFENHLRAILGWPLGETSPVGACRLINLLGQIPSPPPAGAHLYGKLPRPGRKVGHITLVAQDAAEVDRLREEHMEYV